MEKPQPKGTVFTKEAKLQLREEAQALVNEAALEVRAKYKFATSKTFGGIFNEGIDLGMTFCSYLAICAVEEIAGTEVADELFLYLSTFYDDYE